jgi:hypothetical protein
MAAAEKKPDFYRTLSLPGRTEKRPSFRGVQDTAEAGFVATLLSQ